MAGSLRAQLPTSTSLSVTTTSGSPVSSVSSGSVAVLTASVTYSGIEVKLGLVKFCDTVSVHCEGAYLAGSAQLTSKGTAILKFKPAPGVHSYQAFFAGTPHGSPAYEPSISSVANLTVTAGPFPTTTTIVPAGSVGNYTLTATVMSEGEPPLAPTGPVDFLDSSNNNYVLGSAQFTTFTPTSNYAPFVGYNPGGTLGVIVADFNQDGIPDLLVWSESTFVYGGNNYVAVLLGKGDGTFQNPVGYNFDPNSESPNAVAVGDLNGDGYPDVVIADDTTSKIYVLLNDGNGDGRLGWQSQYLFPPYTDSDNRSWAVGPVTGIAIGDVNGDGKPDLAITLSDYADTAFAQCGYTNQSAFGVMLGNGDGSFQTTSSQPYVTAYPSGFCAEVTPQIEPIELVDTRAIGKLDVVVTDSNASNACVSLNNGDGTFASPACYGAPAGEEVAVGDLNGDGYPDLVVSSLFTQNGASAVLLGKGDGTFQTVASTLPNLQAGVTSVALGDLNGDGNLDVVLGNNGADPNNPGEPGNPGTVSVSYGNGNGTFQAAIDVNAVPVGDSVGDVAVADLNGDGVLDVLATANPDTVNVILVSLQTLATAKVTGISPVGPSNGQDGVYASYVGDSYYSGSDSAGELLMTKQVPTTLGLASNLSQITVGGQVTLTATVTPGYSQGYSPSNKVTFFMNGISIGMVTPSNGVAILKPNLTVVQTDSFTATYAGDSNFTGSSSTSSVAVTVQKGSPALTLQICNYNNDNWICPATTSTYGGEITVTATLSPYNVQGGTSSDGETVTFYNGSSVLGTAALLYGSATLNLDQTPAGVYSVTAAYGGDANFNPSSTSGPSTITVAKVASSMSLTTYPTPTSPYGQQVELSATFNTYPYNVNGETVTFLNGATVVGSALLSSNAATLRLNNLPVGNYNFKVTYPGDSNFLASSSTAPTAAVQPLSTALTIVGGLGSTTYGNPVTLEIGLEPYNVPGGNTTNGEPVTIYQNGVAVGTATLSNGVVLFTVNAPPTGTDTYTASYAGDPSFLASTTSQAATLTVQQASTTMGITTNAPHGSIGSGQPIILTATMLPYTVAGGASTNGDTVAFLNGGNTIGTGTLLNGVATYTISAGLGEGSYTFSANFYGDTNFAASSTSPDAALIVLQATTLTLTTNPAHYAALNQPVTITATLSPYASGSDNTNDGQYLELLDGTSVIGNQPMTNGVVTFSFPNGLPEGSYSLTALYNGDGTLAGSTSAPLAFGVVTGQAFVVNTNADDLGTAGYCMPQGSITNNTTDRACSLRDALLAAAAAPEGASIYFDVNAFAGASTITLTNGTLTLPANTTLTGPTAGSGPALTNLVTVNGNGTSIYQTSSTVFTVTGAGTAISNLTITGGWPYSNSADITNGGGILNSGVLTLTNSTLTNNGTFNNGGGIYNTGTLTVVGSTFSNNAAAADGFGNGGGIDNGGGTLTVINSTFANNSVRGGFGGGIAVDAGTATITNSTITGNTVGGGGGGISSILSNIEGVTSPGGTFTLANTIVSGNIDYFSDIDDGGVAYTDQGGNIVGYINRTFTPVNDPTTLNLGPLDNYGGPTQTVLPLPGSQVICAGNGSLSPSQWAPPLVAINIDQRGYPNYNLVYRLLNRSTPTPLPSFCVDSGAVQTNYQSVQFLETSYAGVAGGAVIPTVVASVTENGVSRQAVPVTLNYAGPGNLSGNSATTVAGTGAPFSSLSVDTPGSGALSTTIIVGGSSYINAATNLRILPSLVFSPASESIFAAAGTPLSQTFSVSNGSGSYQLSSSGSLPPGITLTPSGTAIGASWTLSGASSQQGSYNFTLTATDVTDSVVTLSQSYTLTIAPATTTTLAASPLSTAPLGQTVTLTAAVSSPTANGTIGFFDGGNLLGSVGLGGGSPNVATFAWTASTLGTHSFTAQFSGDATDAASASNTVLYNVTTPNFVVNTTNDDNGSSPCTTLASTTSNTTDGNNGGPGTCTLRDALNTASGLGAGSIYFDTTVFAASNAADANTISVDVPDYTSLNIPSNTTIQGLTSGGGATLTNLVTIDGGGSAGPNAAANGTIFAVNGTGAAINNLNINNGYAPGGNSGGAIANNGSITISGSAFTGNQATGSAGGIFNGGSLTVVNSTFYNNSATGGNGGAIDNTCGYSSCGTATVSNSTFYQNTAANRGSGYGGAIYNGGNGPITMTVNSSTIAGNSTDNSNPGYPSLGGGGGIYSGALLSLANNVITANTIGGAAEDDLDDNFSDSNYWTGPNLTTGNNIINGNLIGIWDGLTENGANVALAPLGNYGGPTQTMVPVPGSVAICQGLAASIAAGITADQRGFSNINSIYPGYSAAAPCVDAGSVQTNYAIAFSTEPPLATVAHATLSPAPQVQLTENGALATAAASPVSMSGSPLPLGGTASSSFASGVASFSSLAAPAPTSSEILTATLALNATLNLTATSTAIAVAADTAAILTSPAPGSALTGASATFTWNAPAGATGYSLWIGTNGPGSNNVWGSGQTTNTSVTFNALPINGAPIYVRLFTVFNGAATYTDAAYTVATLMPAQLTSPAPGANLYGAKAIFAWSAATGATEYSLWIGTNGVGSNNVWGSGPTTSTSVTFAALPIGGQTIYVRLFTVFNGAVAYTDATYTAATLMPAQLASPAPGANLYGASATFAWSAATGATEYSLWIGSNGVGSNNVWGSGPTTNTSVTFAALPINGETIYVRLFTVFNNTTTYTDATYTAATLMPAQLSLPSPETTLPGASATFSWAPATGATGYSLWIGSNGVGSNNVWGSGRTMATSVTFAALPVNGETIYVRLFTVFNGTTTYTDSTYTAATQSVLNSPPPRPTLPRLTPPSARATFAWLPAAGAVACKDGMRGWPASQSTPDAWLPQFSIHASIHASIQVSIPVPIQV